MGNGLDEVRDAFLAGNAADEQHVGTSRIDAIFCQRRDVFGVSILIQIDAVVDDVDALGPHLGVRLEDVGLGAIGDRNDGVGIEDGGAFHPRG